MPRFEVTRIDSAQRIICICGDVAEVSVRVVVQTWPSMPTLYLCPECADDIAHEIEVVLLRARLCIDG